MNKKPTINPNLDITNTSMVLDENNNPHEAGYLKLDCSKAAMKLNWHPNWNLEYTLDSIVNWHQNWLSGKNIQEQCLHEIAAYQNNKI
jgi:CDP-glucose 4,6-dehydratase